LRSSRLDIGDVGRMTPGRKRRFERDLAHDDGAAARGHLEAGRAIYYTERDTPRDQVIREHPDGGRELVTFDELGQERIIGAVR